MHTHTNSINTPTNVATRFSKPENVSREKKTWDGLIIHDKAMRGGA
ncbi:hypothetical protein [Pseudomonas chlororaphis]|nr:hypothetical protein [Pseudomonas chlororaphis]AZD01362.1 hypothetical protein C4K27_2168 [Pseudomonas chlororaphis subsp. chlororaphis]MBM0285039.1 hypothetical protein [Pseudomonas chlororaphis]MDO1505712.1 hypothetical protein [Pseudomonas chlororaphis]WDG99731.1 hypothetical protein PUP54_09235 [Pseudomonas chlororaphis]WDH18737.1 hypothetical protein PUP70_11735 [Pseudomonas chlororaphis]